MSESTKQSLTIIANGQTRTVRAGSSVGDLLADLSIAPTRVVVQMDGEIVPRETFARTLLHAGSRLEIITMVGGGQEKHA